MAHVVNQKTETDHVVAVEQAAAPQLSPLAQARLHAVQVDCGNPDIKACFERDVRICHYVGPHERALRVHDTEQAEALFRANADGIRVYSAAGCRSAHCQGRRARALIYGR